ncbi:hypothetical protein LCGC14_2570580 [marine sediment metagenome]|uniref:Acb2/Tad1 hairpin domain-containing protein n=1 Tax=marine sediment metagenome TaxID=412755 RepID=A0A0F9AHB9_9ZZZZ
MRKIQLGEHRFTEVRVLDEPGTGGANHLYNICGGEDGSLFAHIEFQDGSIKENEINGCHQEDLLIVVLDRLQSFQRGEFGCRENALAITKIEEALHWLNHRTQDRQNRGVEGTSKQ